MQDMRHKVIAIDFEVWKHTCALRLGQVMTAYAHYLTKIKILIKYIKSINILLYVQKIQQLNQYGSLNKLGEVLYLIKQQQHKTNTSY